MFCLIVIFSNFNDTVQLMLNTQVLLTWNTDGTTVIKPPPQQQQHPGSLTPPQSDDAATGSPNSLPTLSPCQKDPPVEEKKNKRKKKKTEQPSHQTIYQTGNLGVFYQQSAHTEE